MPFDPDYVRLVLNENFEDAKTLFVSPLLAIHRAHLVMLTECGIIPRDAARTIRTALAGIDCASVQRAPFDGASEDLFFHVEHRLVAACGADTAGHLHTARSRNDIDMTMYRMLVREWLLCLLDTSLELRGVLLALARRHRQTVFAAHTHTQPAQPTTLAHYLLGAIEQLERDARRLAASLASVNQNPLGACAITGTGFPIDRDRTARLLGFDAPTGNTYGSIAAADYLLESVGAVSVLLVGLGRLVQDLLLWSTREVGYLRLPDSLVQTSSVMPQKRNPVPLEHARALASKALGQSVAIPVAVHNTPFGDIVDTEDDLQPLVASVFKDAGRATRLVAVAMREATFDVAKMRAGAAANWVTITELADTLARRDRLPFRTAHHIAATVVREAGARPEARVADLVAEAALAITGRPIAVCDEELSALLSPEHFVGVRRTPGGPAPDVVEAALDESCRRLADDRALVSRRRDQLASAALELEEALAAL